MKETEIFELLKAKMPGAALEFVDNNLAPFIKVNAQNIQQVSEFLFKDSVLDFKSLMSLTAVDNKDKSADSPANREKFTVVYHLFSMKYSHKITLKVDIPRESPALPTVENIWKGANWLEREVFDLFGINFEGHSNLVRIMMPDDWEGYPLRKDYQYPTTYNGVQA